ncbi:concanavalin A-like lectin/glucanase [Rhizoclosmatium globosum]|uniref:Concanavalin A-like lectin/glucanase n=1 Tax=Rhizoclosmatium globosum TaxID=329046 RepID=A0A1Y2B6Q1_9FUNG|nr:concanavalin A-like lectin/glucanase [Rhizoclosmatium globosum]|eukprot:ORY30519.1 concanavalin A-like lectin/glucanase [Rhizoclosmatium globosum]
MKLISVLVLIGGAASQSCGWQNKGSSCPSNIPCCSEYGTCGWSPLHCGSFCQSAFSANSSAGTSPCYGQRFGKKCVSGRYNFDASTWVINSDAFNGDINTADWTVDPLGLDNGNLRFGANGGFLASITKTPTGWAPTDPSDPNSFPQGLGVRVSSTAWVLYGTWESRFTVLPSPGLVTAFISFSEERDEIDWEVTKDNTIGQPNFFYRGNFVAQNWPLTGLMENIGYDATNQFVTFKVDWTPDAITWYINGNAVKTYYKADTCDSNGQNCKYPSTPSRIQFALWDAGAGAPGSRNWAGGYTPWGNNAAVGFNSTVQYISVQCQGDPVPTGPPKRAAGYGAPSLIEPPIFVAVPGLKDYNELAMTRKKSVYGN